jgi:hypothetical protein
MITRYTNIIIAKISEHGGKDKTPTHALKASLKDSKEKPVTVGKFWTRTGQYGAFLSGVMSDTYQSSDKFYDGYVIVPITELDKLEKIVEELTLKVSSPLGNSYPTPELDGIPDPSEIPF